ncbi:MAG: Mov34/MPN/PAD-1 family protein [Candidatus Lokiarchaeota archaeon]|nr:Mov34/MPN/PAD-1 family protein [Candidatus Lokiarchaeota archaeon]
MKERMSNYRDNTIVKIKPIAYYKMLVHILRYGSKTRPHHKFKEVMGMIIGHLEGDGKIKDVIIEDAVPVSHGGSIEVDFSSSDYGKFEAINVEAGERNMFTLGWYHSHPGLSIFFSGTDIRNQQGWQVPNPSAVGIVFDHTYLESPGDLGFRTFRLDDPSKNNMLRYHEVETIVEIPDSLDFYDYIIDLIGKIHSKEPPILELNEKFNIFDDISIPDDNQFKHEISQLDSNKIIDTIKTNISGMIESLLNPLILMINNWSQNLGQGMFNNNLSTKEALKNLKNILITEIDQLQNTILFTLQYNLTNLDMYIDDRFDVITKIFKKIGDSINNLEENIINQIKDSFKEINPELEKKLISLFKTEIESIENIIDNNKDLEKEVDKQNEIVGNLENINSLIQDKITKEFNEYYKNVEFEYDKIHKNTQESLDQFEKNLEKITFSINNLKSEYENSTTRLNKKIEALKDENNKLKKQLNEKKVGE